MTRLPASPAGGARAARPSGARPGKHAPRAPRIPFAALLGVLVLGGMGLLLLLNTASAANEVQRHAYAAQDESVAAQVEQLGNEVAASSAPGNLARAARQLGMVPAANPAFLVLGADGSVTVRGSAAPASVQPVALPPAVRVAPRASKPSSSAHPTPSKPGGTTAAGKSTAPKSSKSTAPTKSTKTTTKTSKPTKSTPTKPGTHG